MKLNTDHLAYLIHLESGIKTEFFSALSATKKKLVLDLAEAKLVIVNDANQIVLHSNVNELFKHLSNEFHDAAMKLKVGIEMEESNNGQTK